MASHDTININCYRYQDLSCRWKCNGEVTLHVQQGRIGTRNCGSSNKIWSAARYVCVRCKRRRDALPTIPIMVGGSEMKRPRTRRG